MTAETTQEDGRVAAMMTRRWLESTTLIELPWNSYKHKPRCTVICADGSYKALDLAGFFLDDKMPVVVENKGVNHAGDQLPEYRKFLAIAYSSTFHERSQVKEDPKRTFIWVTSHPFGTSKGWRTLEAPDTIREALDEFPDLLAGEAVDEDLVRTMSSRVWILVWNGKQERVLLAPDEVARVNAFLGRKD